MGNIRGLPRVIEKLPLSLKKHKVTVEIQISLLFDCETSNI